MANYLQNSTAYLINSKLTPNGGKTFDFTTKQSRFNYFAGKAKHIINNCTYIRKDNTLTVDYNADILDTEGINYVMYNNPTISNNRWFFAFVTKIEYRAMKTAILYLRTDVFMTYQFDIVKNQCFVEREHVSDDTRGVHTLPENVPVNNYKYIPYTNYREYFNGENYTKYKDNYMCSVITSQPIAIASTPKYLSGSATPYYIYICDVSDVQSFVKKIVEENADILIGIYPVIKNLIALFIAAWSTIIYNDLTIYIPTTDTIPITTTTITPDFSSVSGYHPRNEKLNTYPFRYAIISDYNGKEKILKYELMSNYNFKRAITIGVSPTFSLYPENYQNQLNNISNGLVMNALEPYPYITDSYSEYLALNQNSLKFNYISAGVSGATSIINGNISGAIGSISNIIGMSARLADMQKIPDKPHNIASGNMQCFSNNLGLDIFDVQLPFEYLRIIDNYFDCFGYAVNIHKIPQWNSRTEWNYIKTIECSFSGEIPANDLRELNTLFDNGLTVWHNPEHFGNYSNVNTIVGA